jgi:hypothetical protein
MTPIQLGGLRDTYQIDEEKATICKAPMRNAQIVAPKATNKTIRVIS